MKSNTKNPETARAAIEALQKAGFTMAEIRPIIPKLTGTTISQIAHKVGMSCPTVTRTMMGDFGHPLVIRKIAQVLEIPVEILFPERIGNTNQQGAKRGNKTDLNIAK